MIGTVRALYDAYEAILDYGIVELLAKLLSKQFP